MTVVQSSAEFSVPEFLVLTDCTHFPLFVASVYLSGAFSNVLLVTVHPSGVAVNTMKLAISHYFCVDIFLIISASIFQVFCSLM